MIFTIFYNFILAILILLAAPKFLFLYFSKNKYKLSLKKRFGFDFSKIDKKNKPLVWIHAVSVGETRAVAALAKMLKENYTLIISSITETGHAEAKQTLSFADYHLFLPLDFTFIIKPIIRRVKPDFVIISETDLWMQFLKAAKNYGAKTILVNGKISERSANRLKWVPFFCRRLYNLIDFFVVQNTLYQERFLQLGVPLKKINVAGNLKFDEKVELFDNKQLEKFKEKLGIEPQMEVIVVGSTHEGEEKIILDALDQISDKHPTLKIILVPRHPERFESVEQELIVRKASFCRFSKTADCQAKIVLIDEMGLLRKCYSVATLAIVGGSFTDKIGGHNILEPLAYQTPVIFGPYMHSQPDFAKLVKQYEAGIQVSGDKLPQCLDALLSDPKKRYLLGNAGLKLISDLKGSTKTTFELCQKLFSSSSKHYNL